MKYLPFLLLIFLFGSSGCRDSITTEKFDQDKWKKCTLIERSYMSEDLVKSKILIGLTKNQVIEKLGPPKDSTLTNFHYIVDYGYMVPFHLDVKFDSLDLIVKEVTLTD